MKNEKSNKLAEFIEVTPWASNYFEIGVFLVGFLLMIVFGILLAKLNPPVAPVFLNMAAIAFGVVILSSVVTVVYKRRTRQTQQMIEHLKEAKKEKS